MFCTNDFKGNNLGLCPLPITVLRAVETGAKRLVGYSF